MIERIFIVMALTITVSAFAYADEKWAQDPLASDVEWRELSGASKNGKHPLTIEQINQLELGRNTTTNEKTIWGMLNNTTHDRNVNCMKAFGNVPFCKCLGETLPAFLSFKDYIAIVTSTMTQVNFADMKVEEKLMLFNNTINAREQCVTSTFEH